MLPTATQFFAALPHKQCATCGEPIEEQSECYMHVCDECSGRTVVPQASQKRTGGHEWRK